MTEDSERSTSGLNRRTVLRRGTAAAATGVVGVGVFSTTVAAHSCPRTPGYWMNHEWPSSGERQVNAKLPGPDRTEAEWRAYMREPKRGDKGRIMAFHLIATILNFQLTGRCYDVDTPVADVVGTSKDDTISVDGWSGAETFREIKRLAEDWLAASNFPNSQRSWTVPGALVEDGEVLKDLLDAFNNNNLLECTCTENEEFDNVRGGGPPR